MCGIVGLFLKSARLEPRLGAYLAPMLTGMGDAGRTARALPSIARRPPT